MAENELILYGTVGGVSFWDEEFFTSAQVREQLAGMTGPLTVRINSGGGYAHEGQAIYTMLRDYAAEKGEVHTVCDAVAMSAASLIFMAGDRRSMRLGSYLLIHDPAAGFTNGRGTEADHTQAAEQLRVAAKAYAEVYAARAGITTAEARGIMLAETCLEGEAAVLMGFATEMEAAEALLAAKWDYRIYAHAPAPLREASRSLGALQGKQAVMAMMAGNPRTTPKEAPMADETKVAEGTPAEETKKAPAKQQPAPQEAPAPERPVDPYAPPEEPPKVDMAARNKRIRAMTMAVRLPADIADDLIDRNVSIEMAQAELMNKLVERSDGEVTMSGHGPARVVADGRDRFAQGVEKALMQRAGLPGGERNEFTSMRGLELARMAVTASGRRLPAGANEWDITRMALTMVGEHTTSDFGNVLSAVARKSLINGWDEEPEQYGLLTGRPISVPDFRPTTLVGLGFFPTLPEKPEGAEYKYGTLGDRTRSISIATYGEAFAITREAIINDQLDALVGEIPRKMGQAARRTVANIVWNVLLANGGLGVTMPDGQPLFHTSHNNVAASGAALNVTSLSTALSAMRVAKGDGYVIGMRARYLIVPAALEFVAREIVNSAVYPGTNRGMQANPVAGSVEIIVDPRLDAVSTTRWYLMADPNQRDTIKLAYLNGNDQPFMDEDSMWSTDGRRWKVRIEAGAVPGDYQAFFTNAGA